MITITNAPQDAALAQKIAGDLRASKLTVSETIQQGKENLLVLVLSPDAEKDQKVQNDLITALEKHLHVIPVFASPVKLPRLIDHLQPLDFSAGYPIRELLEQVKFLTGPNAPAPLTTLVPSVRAANRRAGYVLLGVVLFIFIVGLIAVGSGLVRRPDAEYDAINTQAAATIHAIVDPLLETAVPRSTEDAINFESTVRALPTGARPLAIATATALAVEND